MRRLLLVVVVSALVTTPAAASSDNWWFKTPGGAAYCGIPKAAQWLCMRPRDGFWIRLTNIYGNNSDIRKGHEERFRRYHGSAPMTLAFGRVHYTSDAAAVTCWSRRSGVTCKQIAGLSFTLGRTGGYRIFWDAPGFPPDVVPLFKTVHGIFCGIDRGNLEPANPILDCWRPADGLVIGIAHDSLGRRGGHGHHEKAIDFRPRGFRMLAFTDTFEWRCRRVTRNLAEKCSTTTGEPVFTCTSTRARLTCRNLSGHGFWASARSFYTF